MFSQRHYVAIADLLKETGFDNPHLVEAFCKLFAEDNDRFKPERFKDAMGFDEFVHYGSSGFVPDAIGPGDFGFGAESFREFERDAWVWRHDYD